MRLPIALLAGLLFALATPGSSVAQSEAEEHSFSTPNFTVAWVTEGVDAPDLEDRDADGVPDAVSRMVQAFEEARTFLLDSLGYVEPPTDGRYPLYVAQGDGRGYTKELPGDSWSRSSFIVIPPAQVRSAVPDGVMKRFAVHEYHHAIQLGYDAAEDIWIREATSTWVEDVYLDDLDPNHRSLLSFLPYPERSLLGGGGSHSYGTFLFLQFLTERYAAGDPTIVRELWSEMAVPEAIPGAPDQSSVGAVEQVLTRRGATLEAAWGEFLMWQRRLGHFEEGASYRRVMADAEWPKVSVNRRVRDETCRIEVPGETLSPFSGDYAVFKPARGAEGGTATLTAVGPRRSSGYFLVKPVQGPAVEHLLAFDEAGVASATVPFGIDSIRRVSMGVGHVAPRSERVAYSVRVAGKSDVEATANAPSSITYLDTASVAGSVLCNGQPAPFARVAMRSTESANGAETVTHTRTGTTGSFRFPIAPDVNTTYSVKVDDPLLSVVELEERRVAVRLFVRLSVPDEAVQGRVARISGTALPVHPGAPVQVEFRRPSREWRQGPAATLAGDGTYEVDVTFPRTGVWEVRVNVNPDDADHATGTSHSGFVRLL